MHADRQSLMLLAVGIVVALVSPWLLLDRRTSPAAAKAEVAVPVLTTHAAHTTATQ